MRLCCSCQANPRRRQISRMTLRSNRRKVTTGTVTSFPRGLGATAQRTGWCDGKISNHATRLARQRHTTVHSYRELSVSTRAERAKYRRFLMISAPISRGDQS